jgi:hypothetical protein
MLVITLIPVYLCFTIMKNTNSVNRLHIVNQIMQSMKMDNSNYIIFTKPEKIQWVLEMLFDELRDVSLIANALPSTFRKYKRQLKQTDLRRIPEWFESNIWRNMTHPEQENYLLKFPFKMLKNVYLAVRDTEIRFDRVENEMKKRIANKLNRELKERTLFATASIFTNHGARQQYLLRHPVIIQRARIKQDLKKLV